VSHRMSSLLPGKQRRNLLIICGVIFLLDQLTKHLVISAWPIGTRYSLIPGFLDLVHFRNSGAAWGILQGHSRLLGALSVVVLGLLVVYSDYFTEGRRVRAVALALICGGIAGNLVDRFLRGEVIDFIFFYFRRFQWPAFNVADSGITCGVVIFIASSLLFPGPPPESTTPQDDDTIAT